MGLNQIIEEHLTDGRRGKNTQLPLPDLLRQSIYSRLAGYEDVNDAERLSQDPTFRLIGSAKIWERGAALPSRLHWFETEVLTQDENLDGLSRINRELLAKADVMDSRQRVVLDMDSTEIPVYGEQEHSAYNGHFESTCYHPLLLFNGEGRQGRICTHALMFQRMGRIRSHETCQLLQGHLFASAVTLIPVF